MDENLLPCMEQKVILLTKILDLTKQLEVSSKQKDIDLGNLPAERKIYIDRLLKCHNLIINILNKSEVAEREHLEKILTIKVDRATCNEEELKLLEFTQKSQELLSKTIALDQVLTHNIEQERDHLRDLVNQSRANKTSNNIFKV